MSEKSDNPTGNHYAVVCNEALWQQMQYTLGKYLADNHVDGCHLWSKVANDYISVGATYSTYRFGGNEVVFTVDRALSREYGNKGYGICLDLTADSASGMPAVSMMTLKGGQCIQNYITGVGGLDGLSSGEVSSPVAGSKMVIHGYVGVCVWNPYRSFILREA